MASLPPHIEPAKRTFLRSLVLSALLETLARLSCHLAFQTYILTMLALQPNPVSLTSFPSLAPPRLHPHKMSRSSPAAPPHTSVFNALGSYADRIKENSTASKPPATTLTSPNGVLPGHIDASASSADKQSPATTSHGHSGTTSQPAPPVPNGIEDEGVWETVQGGRTRSKQDDKQSTGSDSRNWRERAPLTEAAPHEDTWTKMGQRVKENGLRSSGTSWHEQAKQASAPSPDTSTSTSGIGSKSVWGNQTSKALTASQSQPIPSTIIPASFQTSRSHTHTTAPSSPSLNGTTATNNSSSPNLSAADTTLSSTIAPSDRAITDDVEAKADMGQSRVSQGAPLPKVNAWEERKKKTGAPTIVATVTAPPSISNLSEDRPSVKPSLAPVLQFGSVDSSHSISSADIASRQNNNDGVTIATGRKQRKPTSANAAVAPVHVNTALWPDVGQASEASRLADEKKEKAKDKKDSETSTSVEESAMSGSEPDAAYFRQSTMLTAAQRS